MSLAENGAPLFCCLLSLLSESRSSRRMFWPTKSESVKMNMIEMMSLSLSFIISVAAFSPCINLARNADTVNYSIG